MIFPLGVAGTCGTVVERARRCLARTNGAQSVGATVPADGVSHGVQWHTWLSARARQPQIARRVLQ